LQLHENRLKEGRAPGLGNESETKQKGEGTNDFFNQILLFLPLIFLLFFLLFFSASSYVLIDFLLRITDGIEELGNYARLG
jgi:hypothetical protein